MSEYLKAYYKKNREKLLARARKYYAANRADVLRRHQNPALKAQRRIYRQKPSIKKQAKEYVGRPEVKTRLKVYHRQHAGLPLPTRPIPIVCECCGKPPKKNSLSLDHNHKTGEFRGWLCILCNTGIGSLGDSVEGLIKAIRYLNRADLL